MAQVDLKLATIKIKGGGAGEEIEVKVGEGNLSYTENRAVEYTLDKGSLSDVKLGDEAPLDVSLDATWESITGIETNGDVTLDSTPAAIEATTAVLVDDAATPVAVGSKFLNGALTHRVTASTATGITFEPALDTAITASGTIQFIDTVITIEDALKRRQGASTWTSTDTDACNPYCVDLEITLDFPCNTGAGQDETVLLKTFRYESIAHDLSAGTLAITGKCNVTEADAVRT